MNEKIKKTFIKRKNFYEFIIILIISFIIFIPWIQGHYANDTYTINRIGYVNYAIRYSMNDGRMIMALIGMIANKIQMPIEAYTIATLAFSIIISCIVVIELKKYVEKYKKSQNIKQELVLLIVSYITVFNFMYIDCLYFVEGIVMSISLLMYLIVAKLIVDDKSNKNIYVSIIIMILGMFCYQGTICMFVVFLTLFTIIKEKDNKKLLKNWLIGFIIALIAIMLNYIVIKYIGNIYGLSQKRISPIKYIWRNIINIISTNFDIMINTCKLYPKGLLCLISILLITTLIAYAAKNKYSKSFYINLFLVILITYASSSIIFIITTTSFYSGRMRVSIGALIGIIYLFIYAKSNIFDNKNENINVVNKKNSITITILYSILVLYVISNVINYEDIMIQQRNVNIIDKENAFQIKQYVEEYEKNTGIEVKYVTEVFVKFDEEKYFYPSNKNKASCMVSALRGSQSASGVAKMYINENFKAIAPSSKLKEEYLQLNDSKDYECIGDTLCLSIYIY